MVVYINSMLSQVMGTWTPFGLSTKANYFFVLIVHWHVSLCSQRHSLSGSTDFILIKTHSIVERFMLIGLCPNLLSDWKVCQWYFGNFLIIWPVSVSTLLVCVGVFIDTFHTRFEKHFCSIINIQWQIHIFHVVIYFLFNIKKKSNENDIDVKHTSLCH